MRVWYEYTTSLNTLRCVRDRTKRKVANVLEIDDLKSVWFGSPVLNEIRDLSVEAKRRVDKHEDGAYFMGFCLGVAETQTGDPLAMYPQAEINAKAVKRNYELLQIGEGPDGGRKSA